MRFQISHEYIRDIIAHRVVILGGGFGGVFTAIHLEKFRRQSPNLHVTLVSAENYFLMTPLLFEAGSGVLDPRHAVSPIRRMIERTTHFIEAELEQIDFDRKLVFARHAPSELPYEIPYDHLVIALGGVVNRAIIPGSEHAMAFKTLADAIFWRNHIIDAFEHADAVADPDRRRELMTFVIIGAGLVGVELMGELTEFVANIRRSYPRVGKELIQFHLIEAGPHVLPEMERDLADYAASVLEKRGVRIYRSSPVKQIEPGRVHLPDCAILNAGTIVLCAGVASHPLLGQFPLEKDRKGKIAVDGTMRSRSHRNVWAIGDCALIPDPTGKPYPPLAQHALREAKVLAANIVAARAGQPIKPFVYKTLGTLASLGHYQGVGRVMNVKLRGFAAWWVWRSYYLMQMPRFERKLRIVLDWTIALLFRNDIVKLDLFGEEHPLTKRQTQAPARKEAAVR